MSELIDAVLRKSDKVRVTITTRDFQFDGYIHTPKVGKDSRRLSATLNTDRNFVTITDVTITDRRTGVKGTTLHPMLQVGLQAIEYVHPFFDEA